MRFEGLLFLLACVLHVGRQGRVRPALLGSHVDVRIRPRRAGHGERWNELGTRKREKLQASKASGCRASEPLEWKSTQNSGIWLLHPPPRGDTAARCLPGAAWTCLQLAHLRFCQRRGIRALARRRRWLVVDSSCLACLAPPPPRAPRAVLRLSSLSTLACCSATWFAGLLPLASEAATGRCGLNLARVGCSVRGSHVGRRERRAEREMREGTARRGARGKARGVQWG